MNGHTNAAFMDVLLVMFIDEARYERLLSGDISHLRREGSHLTRPLLTLLCCSSNVSNEWVSSNEEI